MNIYDQIKRKPIIIIGQGPSVSVLEPRIQEFRQKDVIWASLNRYKAAEEGVISQIERRFDIIWCSALKRYEETKRDLAESSKNGTLLMSKTAIARMMDFPCEVYESDFGTGFSSIFAMLCALIRLEARRIYLVGFDGRAHSASNVYYRQDRMPDQYTTRQSSIIRDSVMMNRMFWPYVSYALNIDMAFIKKNIHIGVLSGSVLRCFERTNIDEILKSV